MKKLRYSNIPSGDLGRLEADVNRTLREVPESDGGLLAEESHSWEQEEYRRRASRQQADEETARLENFDG